MQVARAGCVALTLSFALALGCSKKAEREWSPSDHDRLDESPQGPQAKQPQPKASVSPGGPSADANSIWQSNCAQCHGLSGKGDGPMGKVMRVPDLTQLQAKSSNDQMASVIKNGRGQMPAYGSFPPEVVDGLVKKIRTMK